MFASVADATRASRTWAKMASVSGTFFRAGVLNPTQAIPEAVEDVADGLTRRHLPDQFGDGQKRVADGLGGDPRVREWGLEFGVGLGVRIDQSADVPFQFGAQFFGRFPPPELVGVEAPDARAEFVQSGVDGVPPPPEGALGVAGRAAAILIRHLGLKPPPLVSCQQRRRQQDGLNDVIPERVHARLLREARLVADSGGQW